MEAAAPKDAKTFWTELLPEAVADHAAALATKKEPVVSGGGGGVNRGVRRAQLVALWVCEPECVHAAHTRCVVIWCPGACWHADRTPCHCCGGRPL